MAEKREPLDLDAIRENTVNAIEINPDTGENDFSTTHYVVPIKTFDRIIQEIERLREDYEGICQTVNVLQEQKTELVLEIFNLKKRPNPPIPRCGSCEDWDRVSDIEHIAPCKMLKRECGLHLLKHVDGYCDEHTSLKGTREGGIPRQPPQIY